MILLGIRKTNGYPIVVLKYLTDVFLTTFESYISIPISNSSHLIFCFLKRFFIVIDYWLSTRSFSSDQLYTLTISSRITFQTLRCWYRVIMTNKKGDRTALCTVPIFFNFSSIFLKKSLSEGSFLKFQIKIAAQPKEIEVSKYAQMIATKCIHHQNRIRQFAHSFVKISFSSFWFSLRKKLLNYFFFTVYEFFLCIWQSDNVLIQSI